MRENLTTEGKHAVLLLGGGQWRFRFVFGFGELELGKLASDRGRWAGQVGKQAGALCRLEEPFFGQGGFPGCEE